MKKLTILFSFLFFLLLAPSARAVDLNVNCPGTGSCSVSGQSPLFSSSADGLWYPGRALTKTFSIVNGSADSQLVGLRSSRNGGQSILEDVLFVSLVRSGLIWSGSLVDFNQAGEIQLATLSPGSSAVFSLTASMETSAANQYQNLQSVFDLILGFISREVPAPTATPSLAPSPTPTVYENPPSGIILNEIMANPPSGKEWVEIHNSNPFPVRLKQWYLDDSPASGGSCSPRNLNVVDLSAFGFYAFEYPNDCLDNGGDIVRLLNHDGILTDSKTYAAADVSTANSYSRQSAGNWCLASPSFELANNPCLGASPTLTPTTAPGIGGDDGSTALNGTASAPVCSDSAPLPPQSLTAVLQSPTSALLSWGHPASSFTSYLVAYGPQPGVYLYGNPNIGNDNSYVVSSLSPGVRYCFVVRAQNGCAPGPFSNEVCVNPASTLPPPPAPVSGFAEGVLGEQTQSSPSSPAAGGAVEGAATTCPNPYLPVLFLLALLLNILYLRAKKTSMPPAPIHLALAFLLSLISFAVDFWLLKTRCCQSPALLCRYYYLGAVASFLLPAVFYLYRPQK